MSDNMILEYGITETFSQFATSYTALLQNPDSKEYYTEYNSSSSALENIFTKLDNVIVYNQSVEQYTKIKNMARSLKTDCDNSLFGLSERNFTQATGIYDRTVRGDAYVRDNTASLILSELEYSKELQKNLKLLREWTLYISITLVALIVLGSSFFAFWYSNRLSAPLIKLSNVAEGISKGNLNMELSRDLLEKKDEVGTLSNSFNEMLKRINIEIESQKEINNSLADARNQLMEKNIILEDKEAALVEINSRLEESNAKLKSLDEQKDEFISLVAHELKTPLTSIQGFTQVLRDKETFNDPEKNNHYLELVEKNANRLYNLVTDIVDSSRINLGRLKFNIDVHDPYRIFNDIKENMTISISKKGLAPEFSIENGLPKIRADFERTMQVLNNIISNSIKFTVQGMISLHVEKEGEFVKFTVKDTGQGIPEENKNAIFSRFYQVDSEMTRKIGGSGLGLSICKGLVEGMGGKIGFESETGKGSTFYFTLPIAKDAQ